MPAVPANSHILITGASGYIAIHCVDQALKKGFKVTGTVRSDAKGEYIKKKFAGKPFEYIVVEDISDPKAFDGVVEKGQFDGILHTASPFHLKADDPKEVIEPAVNGTVGILKSAQKTKSVKRIVVTSSVASIMDTDAKPPKTFTEADWNTTSPRQVEKDGKKASNGAKYQASKTLAEKEAWKIAEESGNSFDLATVLPSYVYGPILHEVSKPDSLNTSVGIFYNYMKNGIKPEDLPGMTGAFVDVRDVAEAHIECLLQEKAGGQRFLTTAGPWCSQHLIQLLHELDPKQDLPETDPKKAEEAVSSSKLAYFDGSKYERELGQKYITLDKCVEDMYKSLKDYESSVWA